MDKSETKPNENQEEFKIYLLLSTEIGKLNYNEFSTNQQIFHSFTCEKIFPTDNNRFQTSLLSSTYNINELKDKDCKDFFINYSNGYITENKYALKSYDNYLFDVYFKKNNNNINNIIFPKQLHLSGRIQYKNYCEFLKENHLQSTYTKKNLNRDVMKFVTNSKTIDFLFYLDIFKEVFNTEYVKVLLSLFKSEKIIMRAKIDPKTHSAILNLIYKKSDKVLDLIKGGKKKNFGERLYLFIIFYYYNVKPTEFQKIMDEKVKKYNDEFEVNLIDLFFDNEIMFKANDDNNIIYMFNYVKSYEQLICLLKKFKLFSNWLMIILKNIELIYQLLKKEKKQLNIDECPSQPKENEFNNIFNYIKKIEEYSNKINYKILIIPSNFNERLLSNCGNNIENLNQIKQILSKQPNSKQLLLEIEEKEHNICENKILNNKLINTEMLECLREDPYYQKPNTDKYYNNKKNIAFILDRIHFSQLRKSNNEEINKFFVVFVNFNFEKILPPQSYIEFIKTLINKINHFDEFSFIFHFISKGKNNNILSVAHQKLIQLLQVSKGKSENTKGILNSYIQMNLNNGNKNYVKEIINEIDRIMNRDKAKEIILDAFMMINNDKELSQFILNLFEKDLNNANIDSIMFLLETVNKKENLRELFKKFNPLIMKEEDIYNEKDSEKYKIYNYMKSKGLFEDNSLKDIDYFKQTNNLIKKIYNDLKDSNIDLTTCTNIYNYRKKNDKTFINRLSSLFGDKNSNELYKTIIKGIISFLKIKNGLKEIVFFLISFYPSCKDKAQITKLVKSMNESKLKDYKQ